MEKVNLVPAASRLNEKAGSFPLDRSTPVTAADAAAEPAARLLAGYLSGESWRAGKTLGGSSEAGFEAQRKRSNGGSHEKPPAAVLLEVKGPSRYDEAGFADESCTVEVGENGCRLSGATKEGLARAVQIFRQLLPPEVLASGLPGNHAAGLPQGPSRSGAVEIPACSIEDTPRFRWRGVHLDVGRHFFPIEDVCRFIDLAAFHRLNRIHLHLTEDQGWRIEIKKYPKLTGIGSRRSETLVGHFNDKPHRFDSTPYGGYYTQDDIRKLVAFAEEREVVLVPEIDMPGHMQAAVSAYPEWGCTGRPVPLREIWGISQDILNVEEPTVAAMKDILAEVMDLFPGRFIHVGGDEVPKEQWETNKRVQQRMREIGVKNEEELQSWFIRQMDDFITSHGRRTIGWDEILEGGLAENAAVMSWRGEEGGIAAAKMGHDVVMAPMPYTYFDHYQDLPEDEEPLTIGGFTPLSKVYSYEPVPKELHGDAAERVLGAQAQLWTEYIPTRERLDYMAYPRLCALAEVLSTAKGSKNYAGFLERLGEHRKRLSALGVNAHPRP